MSDSLVIGSLIELLGGGVVSNLPLCAGAMFRLSPGWDLSTPQVSTDVVASMILGGGLPIGLHVGNRTPKLPVTIVVPPSGNLDADRATLAGAREMLLQAVSAEQWQLVWTREGALPMILDCFHTSSSVVTYSLPHDLGLVSQVEVDFEAMPYGKSDTPEVIFFNSPATSWVPPPASVSIDTFATVSSSTDSGLFSSSARVAVGAQALHWSRSVNNAPNYTHALSGTVNITGLRKLSVWLGLGTTSASYSSWHTGKVTVSVILTDAGGNTVTIHITTTCRASGLITAPHWQKVSGWIPQVTSFDYTTVSSYQLQAWNRAGPGGAPVLQAEAYFDTLRADAASTGTPGPRGAIYSVGGAVGTAPAAVGLQLQPGASVVQQTALFTTVGSNNWTAPVGVTSVQKVQCWGGGSGGAQGGQWGGAGGAGGEYAEDYNVPVTPSTVYHPVVGAAGLAGDGTHGGDHRSTAGGNSSFTGDSGFTVTAHGGQPAGIGQSFYAGHGGDGSVNSLHYPGGNGLTLVPGVLLGSGGGGSGGPYSPGKQAPGTTSAPTPGAPAVDQGGPGGKGGGLTAPHAGFLPASGPGGGGGGGTGIAGGTQPSGANGFAGQVRLTWAAQLASPLKTAIVHRPRPDAPSSIAPAIVTGNGTDTPNGATTYTAPATGSLQARYYGTYQVIITNSLWSAPTTSRTVTVTIQQHKADGTNVSVQLARTFVPNTDPDSKNLLNGLVLMGTVNLPLAAISPGNNTDLIQVTVNDTVTADRFLDTLLLDLAGQTVIYSASGSGVNNLWITEPDIGPDVGTVYGSQADWDTASSVMSDVPVISGGPMSLQAGENPFFVYSVQAAPALLASYLPRWRVDRLS